MPHPKPWEKLSRNAIVNITSFTAFTKIKVRRSARCFCRFGKNAVKLSQETKIFCVLSKLRLIACGNSLNIEWPLLIAHKRRLFVPKMSATSVTHFYDWRHARRARLVWPTLERQRKCCELDRQRGEI
jgi:hypothetical protein